MAVTWPATVPTDINQSGYNESPPDVSLRQPMAVGPPKVRRRSSAGVRPINGIIRMTGAQLETFDAWYVSDLSGGTLPFDFPNPRTSVSKEMMFAVPPTYTPAGGDFWKVGVKMQVLP